MNYRSIRPRIMWGPTFQKEVVFGYPLDSAVAYREPRAGSEWVQGASGVEDAWVLGPDELLEGDVRWLPISRTASPLVTGWHGGPGGDGDGKGIKDWLSDARKKNVFRWHPDGRNLLLQPALVADADVNGIADSWTFNKAAGVTGAGTIDVGTSSQKITVTANTGANGFAEVYQELFGDFAPGDQITIAVEYQTAALVATANARVYVQTMDAANTVLGAASILSGLTAGGFTRVMITHTVQAGAVDHIRVRLRMFLNAIGDTGIAYFRNAVCVRGAVDPGVFIDNVYFPMYLVDPMNGPPELENDLTRKLHLKMRTSDASAIVGY
jgi:hypothetical protein